MKSKTTKELGISSFEKSGWAIAHVIVSWRRQVSPLLRKAEKTDDPEQRIALMANAARQLEGRVRSLYEGIALIEKDENGV